MTVHECPHCECAECQFCGKELKEGTYGVSWTFFDPPPMYTKKFGHECKNDVTACNECMQLLDYVMTQLQRENHKIDRDTLNRIAEHPRFDS